MKNKLTGVRLGLAGYLAGAILVTAGMPVAGEEAKGFLFDSPREINAGRELAEAQCAQCHGIDGVADGGDVPYLASQRPGYLYDELSAYRKGGRKHQEMTQAVRFLSDAALRQAAAYYGSLDAPRIEPKGEPLEFPDPIALGAEAADTCNGCHGDGGVSETPGTPSLIGLHPQYLAAATRAYRSGTRSDDTMSSMVEDLGEAEIDNIALYYGLQPPLRSPNEAEGDVARGGGIAAACTGCHGEHGASTKPDTPSLAGQDAEYLVNATTAYRDGRRKSSAMESPVAKLSDTDIVDVAAYFAAQAPQAPQVRKPLSIEQWVERCDRCHGTDGNSRAPHMPGIAGQSEHYLARVLREYRDGERHNQFMNAMLEPLSDASIQGLAAYYSRKQPRAVVFVQVPATK